MPGPPFHTPGGGPGACKTILQPPPVVPYCLHHNSLFLRGFSRGPGYRLGFPQRVHPIQRFRPKSAGGNVIPIEVLAGPTILESNLKAPIPWDGLVLDDANAACVHMNENQLDWELSRKPGA